MSALAHAQAPSAPRQPARVLVRIKEIRVYGELTPLPLAAAALAQQRTNLGYEAVALIDEVERMRRQIDEAKLRLGEIHDQVGEIDAAIGLLGGAA